MTWLFPRFLAARARALLAMVVGGVIGYRGDHIHAPLIGALLGGAVGVGVIALIDTIRGHR